METRIRGLLESGEARHRRAFADFLAGLRDNINVMISTLRATMVRAGMV